MPQFFLVLFKVNIVLLLFAITYILVLRKLTFYTLNRIFLIFGILFSTVYPFINLTDFFAGQPVVQSYVPQFKQNVNQLLQSHSSWDFWQILTVVFFIGLFLMLIRLAVQFYSLRKMHLKSRPFPLKNLNVRILTDEVSPFSFWKTIYINPKLHKEADLKNILEHEKIHVDELHTLDIVLAEISLAFYWFNPGIWLMKNAVKENLEFITDAKILHKGIDKKTYQYSLLDVGTLQHSVALVNNFNLSDLKKRILMMNKKRSSNYKLLFYAVLLPLILITTLAFTIDKKTVSEQVSSLSALPKISKAVIQSFIEKTEPAQRPVAKKTIIKERSLAENKPAGAVAPILDVEAEADSATRQPKTEASIRNVIVRSIKVPFQFKSDSLKASPEIEKDVSAPSPRKISLKLFRVAFNKDSVVWVQGRKQGELPFKNINPENIKNITVRAEGVRKVIYIEAKN